MQEVFLRLVKERDRLEDDTAVLRWVYRVTTNLCLNRLRQKRTHPVIGDPDAVLAILDHPRGDQVDRATLVGLFSLFDELTIRMVVHYYLDEMNMDEVAETVGQSRKTVSKKIEKFRRRARAILAERATHAEVRGP